MCFRRSSSSPTAAQMEMQVQSRTQQGARQSAYRCISRVMSTASSRLQPGILLLGCPRRRRRQKLLQRPRSNVQALHNWRWWVSSLLPETLNSVSAC